MPSAGEDVEKLAQPGTARGDVQRCSRCVKELGGSSEKLHTQLPEDPGMLVLGVHPGKGNHVHTEICTRMSTAALFAGAEQWKQPKRP